MQVIRAPRGPIDDIVLSVLLAASFCGLVAGGYAFFRSGAATIAGSELSAQRSLFTTVNSLTLTGFQQTIAIDTYTPRGQWFVLMLTIVGSLISMIVGSLAVVRILKFPWTTRRVVMAALIVEAGAILAGTAAITQRERPLVADLLLAASAFGNSGLVIGSPGDNSAWTTQFVLLPLSVLGGFGLPVLIELYDRLVNRRRLSAYTWIVLAMSGAIYLAGVGAIRLANQPASGSKEDAAAPVWQQRLIDASSVSLNSRTLGLPLEQAGAWPRSMQWIVVLLMFVGASPAGTAGGLKSTTLFELCRGAWLALRGRAAGKIFGIAAVWTAVYLLVIITAMAMLLQFESSLPGDRGLFIAVSAAANVGLSLDPVSVTGDGMVLLSVVMLLGRMLPWAVLWWSALATRDAEIAVG